ncbi:MAG: aminopeptidase [Anaerolineales bacterium]|nr:aminopeptidase [Anaerolineales bacterium]
MNDARIEKLADLLVNYSVAIQPGDKVILAGPGSAAPLLKAIYARVLQAGGLPMTWISLFEMQEILYRTASDEQLQFVPEPYKLAMETFDAEIHIMGDENTKALSNIDPQRMVTRRKAFAEINHAFLERAARKEVRWTLALFPTQAYAQDAEMSLGEYEDFVYRACMPDMDDPVSYWQRVSARQDKIIAWLKDKRNVHVTAPGTDLRLSVAGRKFINCACRENVPDGEIFTAPVEDSLEGHVHFTYPSIYDGRQVDGVRLWFEKGKVVRATADKNEAYLLKTLDTDEGSRYVGEFAIGTNEGIDRFTGEILFDEKIGGSFHLALGEGYPESGSINKSGLHWDMICDLRHGGEIWADDQLMYKDGQFVIEA